MRTTNKKTKENLEYMQKMYQEGISSKKNIYTFFNKIYSDNVFCLKRKKDKVSDILREYRGN